MAPKMAFLLPLRNGEKYLKECLDSVLAQTEKDFECWVSDDGSSDRSRAIVQGYSDPRIHYQKGPCQGLFANLNSLMQQATAPWVHILCQDDRLQRDCAESELRFLQCHPLVSISFCKANRIDEKGMVLSRPELDDLPDILSPDLSQQHFFYHGCIAGNLSTVCFRKDLVTRYGDFDASLVVSGDFEYWARICEKEYLGIIQKPLVDLRVHSGQLSRHRRSVALFVEENRQIRQKVLARLPKKIGPKAKHYENTRHDVLDLNSAISSFRHLDFKTGAEVLKTFSFQRMTKAFLFWLSTLNNRLYRPQAPWVLTCDWPNTANS